MNRAIRSKLIRQLIGSMLVCSSVLLTACVDDKVETSEAASTPAPAAAADHDRTMEWASAALARNPQIELVATDSNSRVFTLRNKQTGEVSAVKLNELAAAPVSQLATSPTSQSQMQESEPAATASRSAEATDIDEPNAEPRAASQGASNDVTAGYTIERNEGQVRVTGPGVSIVSSGPASEGGAQAAAENASEPIICEGARMVHFDNREIFVEGDAITVRGGCELYITNSRIVASGTGIVVQDGTVHVSNSHIEGAEGSFDADSRAKVFVRASTFRGLPRRSELALVQDQGGNRWR